MLLLIPELHIVETDSAGFHRERLLRPGGWSVVTGTAAVVVELGRPAHAEGQAGVGPVQRQQPQCVVVGVGDAEQEPPDWVDVVVSAAEAAHLCTTIKRNPHASTMLVQLLRATAQQTVPQALLTESLAYSTLQHGAEFADWRSRQDAPRQAGSSAGGDADPVLAMRQGDSLELTLNRPAKRNAWSAAMRNALCESLELALCDSSIEQVLLRGAGPAFCAGGDLGEFGHARDAALAHLSRVTLSAGQLLHQLRTRVVAEVHGACVGAGIELPAFADRVLAQADSFFQLPEISMGLIPGAGGTVSLPRRVGRQRTAWLALSGERIDAHTALDWGLVDELL